MKKKRALKKNRAFLGSGFVGGLGFVVGLVCLGVGVILGAASVSSQGALWGDLGLTRGLQGILGVRPLWALWLTETGKMPWLLVSLVVAVGLSFLRGGKRGAALPIVALAGVMLLDAALRWFYFVPRPFVEASAGGWSSFPSTFVLHYGALFGGVLWLGEREGILARIAGFLAVSLLVLGGMARIILAGHWGSQVLSSLGLSLVVVALSWGLCKRL